MGPTHIRSLAVIGSGIAGLTIARETTGQGIQCTVFEKSRGPGGRLSSKRAEGGVTLDMGAQYFTVYDPRFSQFLKDHHGWNVLQQWDGTLMYETGTGRLQTFLPAKRWVGVPRMSALTRQLATGLDLHTATPIEQVTRSEEGWWLHSPNQKFGPFDAVVSTAPPAQTAGLIPWEQNMTRRLGAFAMTPCWAVALGFAEATGLDYDGIKTRHEVIDWAACNSDKPDRSAGHMAQWWVVHATPEWSRQHQDDSPDEVIQAVGDAFCQRLGVAVKPQTAMAHRWLYARSESPERPGFLCNDDETFAAVGDWLTGGRVEGAWRSARQLLDHWQL